MMDKLVQERSFLVMATFNVFNSGRVTQRYSILFDEGTSEYFSIRWDVDDPGVGWEWDTLRNHGSRAVDAFNRAFQQAYWGGLRAEEAGD